MGSLRKEIVTPNSHWKFHFSPQISWSFMKKRTLAALGRKGRFLGEHQSMFLQDESVIWKHILATELFFNPRLLRVIFSLLPLVSAEATNVLHLQCISTPTCTTLLQKRKRVNLYSTAESAHIILDNTSFFHFTAERQGLLWQQHCLSYQDYAEASLIVLVLKHISAGSDIMCLASM